MKTCVCTLCGRTAPRSRHHLTPKSKARRKKKDDEPVVLAGTCVDCHRKVHASFSNNDLAKSYETIENLRDAPGMAEWLKFISRKPGTERVATHSANGRGRH